MLFAILHSPTGVLTDGDDLDGLFLPEELVSDDASAALLSDCKKKVRTEISVQWKTYSLGLKCCLSACQFQVT